MIVLLTVFIGIPCSAASGFYCEYTPKSEKSTVFYIDLYSSDEVSAAVMELSFDESFVEYREVSAVEKTSTVRSACDNGNVRIAFADSDAVNGRLCRVAFKALQTGTCSFTLHISQAADNELDLMSDLNGSTVEVKLGKDDIVASSSSKESKSSSKASGNSDASSRSSISSASEDEDGNADIPVGGFNDLRRQKVWPYILIGAFSVILIAGLVFFGVLIGRKKSNKNKPDDKENPNV